jgi:hypothetical protein
MARDIVKTLDFTFDQKGLVALGWLKYHPNDCHIIVIEFDALFIFSLVAINDR